MSPEGLKGGDRDFGVTPPPPRGTELVPAVSLVSEPTTTLCASTGFRQEPGESVEEGEVTKRMKEGTGVTGSCTSKTGSTV